MAQQTAMQEFIQWAISLKDKEQQCIDWICIKSKAEELLAMEKEKHDAWNAFLEREKTLGTIDVQTIERIKWYYNQYYNETYRKD
jgi:hypothetical protein